MIIKDILSHIEAQKAGIDINTDWSREISQLREFRNIPSMNKAEVIRLVRRINRADNYFSNTDRLDILSVIDEMIPIQRKLMRVHKLSKDDVKEQTKTRGAIYFSDNLTEEGKEVQEKLMQAIRTILKDENRLIEGEHADKNGGKRVAVLLMALEDSGYIVKIDGKKYTVKNWLNILNGYFAAGIKSEQSINAYFRDRDILRGSAVSDMQDMIETLLY